MTKFAKMFVSKAQKWVFGCLKEREALPVVPEAPLLRRRRMLGAPQARSIGSVGQCMAAVGLPDMAKIAKICVPKAQKWVFGCLKEREALPVVPKARLLRRRRMLGAP